MFGGCYFGGITLKSGRRGFAVYCDGKIVAQYTAMGRRSWFRGFWNMEKCVYLHNVRLHKQMKHPLIILTLLFSSIFSLSAQTRLGTTSRIINRADNHYYALDSLFLGEEYSNTLMGVAMITKNAFGGNASCLRSNYDPAKKRHELVYLVLNQKRKGRMKVTSCRCTISSEVFF